MKIVGILNNSLIIEPQYGGDNETYLQLTEKGMKELRDTFNVKQYASMEDFHADYFYGISEAEYLEQIKAGNHLAEIQRNASKPLGNIESNFMEDYINDVYEQNDDIPF